MTVADIPPYAHTADDLREIAERRGIDLAEVAQVICRSRWCGVPADWPVTIGYIHDTPCDARDQDIVFVRKAAR